MNNINHIAFIMDGNGRRVKKGGNQEILSFKRRPDYRKIG